jgi:hypothetical protein
MTVGRIPNVEGGIQPTLLTTAGDIMYASSASNPARLGIGTASQILAVNSGATAPEWVAAPTASANWSLLNAGGTALTGAQTITVSGISGKDKIMVLMNAASTTITTSPEIGLRLNTDTGGNYAMTGVNFSSASYAPGRVSTLTNTYITLAKQNTTAASTFAGAVTLTGCNSSGVKAYQAVGGADGTGSAFNIIQGYYNSSSTISSISLFSENGNFDAGTVYVYTSA